MILPFKIAFTCTMIAMVARWYSSGCDFDQLDAGRRADVICAIAAVVAVVAFTIGVWRI